MCLAIFKPSGKKIPHEHLQNGFENNPHGAGFSYARDGELITKKGFFRFKDFLREYEGSVTDADPATVHFRLATHGATDEYNCHPFPVQERKGKVTMSLIHNGVIHGWGNVVREGHHVSDTAQFCYDFVKPLLSAFKERDINFRLVREVFRKQLDYNDTPPAFRKTLAVIRAISSVGEMAKLCVLAANGDWFIFGERHGTFENGIWYSNQGFCSYRSFGRSGRFVIDSDEDLEINGMSDLTEDERREIDRWSRGHIEADRDAVMA